MIIMNKENVSVIIPTYNRPDKVLRAVYSVLNQTLQPKEIIVIGDGPNPKTKDLIRNINHNSIIYKESAVNKGSGAARNLGIELSSGEWIALLDDDDWWLPKKLEIQFNEALKYNNVPVLISGQEKKLRHGRSSVIEPKSLPSISDSVASYVFEVKINNESTGKMHTSTWFGKSWLFKTVPFREDLPRHQDLQWLIDVSIMHNPIPVVISEVIAIQEIPPYSTRRVASYNYTKNWYLFNYSLLSTRVRRGILVKTLSRKAAEENKLKEFFWIFKELVKEGKSNKYEYVQLLKPWIINEALKKTFVSFFLKY
jgi:glycosyltransferase involved in cell wall biosynthesis